MLKSILFLLAGLGFSQSVVAAEDIFDDEDDGASHHQYKTAPGDEWKELGITLPAYPRSEDLVVVDVARVDYPFTVFVDPGSVSVGKDRVIRFTVVLRSPSGAETVSYEGVRCIRRKYKRYAYGSNAQFRPAPVADWAFIRRTRQDLYRAVLTDNYFCPLPGGDNAAGIRRRLKDQGAGGRYPWAEDE